MAMWFSCMEKHIDSDYENHIACVIWDTTKHMFGVLGIICICNQNHISFSYWMKYCQLSCDLFIALRMKDERHMKNSWKLKVHKNSIRLFSLPSPTVPRNLNERKPSSVINNILPVAMKTFKSTAYTCISTYWILSHYSIGKMSAIAVAHRRESKQ